MLVASWLKNNIIIIPDSHSYISRKITERVTKFKYFGCPVDNKLGLESSILKTSNIPSFCRYIEFETSVLLRMQNILNIQNVKIKTSFEVIKEFLLDTTFHYIILQAETGR